MIDLTADTFHRTMAEKPAVACILHHGGFDSANGIAVGADWADGPFVWTRIDIDAAPEIGAMFRLAEDEPYLLVMRESVVLYCQPLSSRSPEATRLALDKAARLDMKEVRRQVDLGQLGRDALLNRRACPTTWRTARRQR